MVFRLWLLGMPGPWLVHGWRVQLLQQLHAENKIGCRFPIGREEQVPLWDVETIKAFHRRWYFPANATLYVVGDIGSVSQTVKLIEVGTLGGATCSC